MENPIKMDDLGETPLFLETPICSSGSFAVRFVSFREANISSLSPGP